MPTVSVILPTYNRERLLRRAIQSVLDQTYGDFELIIVDDCSTDTTEKLVRTFTSEKIRYIKHSENRGASAARNTGIELAKGKYIAFQDSDDEWMRDKLEKQIAVFEKGASELGVVYTGSIIVTGRSRRYIPCFETRGKNHTIFASLLGRRFIPTVVMVVKSECLEKVGWFDVLLPCFEEWDLFLRIAKYYQFKGIDEPLVVRYPQRDSLSQNLTNVIRGYQLILEKYLDDVKHDSKLLAEWYLKLGHMSSLQGKSSLGRHYLIESMRSYPFDIRPLISLAVSWLGKDAYQIILRSYRGIQWLLKGK